MNSCIYNSFYLYLIIMTAIYIIKPKFLFYNNDKNKCLFKKFGCGKNKTILSIHILSIILAIFIYFVSLFFSKLENK